MTKHLIAITAVAAVLVSPFPVMGRVTTFREIIGDCFSFFNNKVQVEANLCHHDEVLPLFTEADGHLSTVAMIDGTACRLYVDTGSNLIVLKNQVRVSKENCGKQLVNAGAQTQVSTCRIKTLKLGSIAINNIYACKAPLGRSFGPGIDGILGTTVLGLFCCTFDFVGKRLILSTNSGSINRDKMIAFTSGYWLPLSTGPKVYLPANLDGQSISFLADSGSNVSVLDNSTAQVSADKALKANSVGSWSWTAYAKCTQVFGRIQIGKKIVLRRPQFDVEFTSAKRATLGLDFLRQFRMVTFDFRNKIACFVYPKDTTGN